MLRTYGNRGKPDALRTVYGKPMESPMESLWKSQFFPRHLRSILLLFALLVNNGLSHNLPTVLPTGFPQPLLRASDGFPTVPTGRLLLLLRIMILYMNGKTRRINLLGNEK